MAGNSKIKSDIKLNQFCLDILKDYLDDDCVFIPDINSSKEKSYHLGSKSGYWETRINAHGKDTPVVKLCNGFYLSFTIEYKPDGRKLDFKAVSLQFYDKEALIFRAEWDNWEIKKAESNKVEDIMPHPQPHWHLAEIKEKKAETKMANTFEEHVNQDSFVSFEQADETKPNKLDYSRLHFFMKMDEDSSPYYFDLTYEENFKYWLSETMKHVEMELSYLIQ